MQFLPFWREVVSPFQLPRLWLSPVYRGVGVPRGRGSGVVLVQGFMSHYSYLWEMYSWLHRIGYTPYFSGFEINNRCPQALSKILDSTVDKAYRETGGPGALWGHSLGGVLARGTAIRKPGKVSHLITAGSPFRSIRVNPGVKAAADLMRLRARAVGEAVDNKCYTPACKCEFATTLREQELPISVVRRAIYTPNDGIVDFRSCIYDDQECNEEVSGNHVSMPIDPAVWEPTAFTLHERRLHEVHANAA